MPTAERMASCLFVASDIQQRLEAMGCTVTRVRRGGHAPLLFAHREPAAGQRTIGLYGHYDVCAADGEWSSDPGIVTVRDGRVFCRGIADNLGSLALRLLACRDVRLPGLVWLIDGGEEVGSPALSEWLSESRLPHVDLWLDETGYFSDSRTQRVLACNSSPLLESCLSALGRCAALAGVAMEFEQRRLRRVEPRNAAAVALAMGDCSYLSFGFNDARSNIHAADESLSPEHLSLVASQLVSLFAIAAGEEP